jgi:ATP/maltotriose-dependent transcriptional regulator MalT
MNDEHTPEPDQVSEELLSEREREVLHLIAAGMTNTQIAQQLVVTPGTVKMHNTSIFRKLAVKHRAQAVERATELGILRDR